MTTDGKKTWREEITAILVESGGKALRSDVMDALQRSHPELAKGTVSASLANHTRAVREGDKTYVALKGEGGDEVTAVTSDPVSAPVDEAGTDVAPEVDTILPEMVGYIPKKDTPYYPRKVGGSTEMTDWDLIVRAYTEAPTAIGRKMNVLIFGPTGTGKTHLLRHLACELKVPYMRLNLNGGTTVEAMLGQWVPDEGEGNSSRYRWVDGHLTRFVRNGGIIVLDEVNAAPAEILFVLHGLLDEERRLVLTDKDGEVLSSHPEFMLCATMNPDYEGTRPLNAAFADRFDVKLEVDYDEKVDAKVLGKDAPEGLLGVVKKLRAMTVPLGSELTVPVSTRALKQFMANLRLFGFDMALDLFVQRYPPGERKAVKSTLEREVRKPSK